MRAISGTVTAALLVALTGCGVINSTDQAPESRTPMRPSARSTPSTAAPSTTAPSTAAPAPEPSRSTPPARTGPDDPRWQFFTDDRTRYRSPWFDGAQRVMIPYGCTAAPFYAPDARCGGRGFHHGIDVALPCGTTIFAGTGGRVIDPSRPGRPGPAYGSTAFRLRVVERGRSFDILIGHTRKVLVRPGDVVGEGDAIALAGARGAPDGCHLHFEQRRPDGGVSSARNPARLLGLEPAG